LPAVRIVYPAPTAGRASSGTRSISNLNIK
jgi:hypothetical protein